MVDVSLAEAHRQFLSLVRRAAAGRERVLIKDHEQPAAVLINAEDLEDLEDGLAAAQYELRRARGEVTLVPQAQARERLGLPPSDL